MHVARVSFAPVAPVALVLGAVVTIATTACSGSSSSPGELVVQPEDDPALLFTTNRADDIVHPCHSRKFAARLADLGYRDVFYYEMEEGGHGKAYSGPEQAMIISFFLRYLHPDYVP